MLNLHIKIRQTANALTVLEKHITVPGQADGVTDFQLICLKVQLASVMKRDNNKNILITLILKINI